LYVLDCDTQYEKWLNDGLRLLTNHRNNLHLPFANPKFFACHQRFDTGMEDTIMLKRIFCIFVIM